MALIERYILRQSGGAFLATLLSLTAVIWITQALRDLDLLTSKGQTVVVFLTMTSLTLPLLVLVIAPVALFIAVVYTLNRLNNDSELVILSAAGASPIRVIRPLLILTLGVMILTAFISLYVMPHSLKTLRYYLTQVRADIVSHVLQPGKFTPLEKGITFHIRAREGKEILLGLLVDDRRNPKEHFTYLAERGQLVRTNDTSFLVMLDGSIQRRDTSAKDANIIEFERYGFDLSQLTGDQKEMIFKPRERTTEELLFPDLNDPAYQFMPGRFLSELHDRFSNPLYPLAFTLIALAALGQARTTRQGRTLAIVAAIGGVLAVRIGGFSITSLSAKIPDVIPLMYIIPLLASGYGLSLALGWTKLPRFKQSINAEPTQAPLRTKARPTLPTQPGTKKPDLSSQTRWMTLRNEPPPPTTPPLSNPTKNTEPAQSPVLGKKLNLDVLKSTTSIPGSKDEKKS